MASLQRSCGACCCKLAKHSMQQQPPSSQSYDNYWHVVKHAAGRTALRSAERCCNHILSESCSNAAKPAMYSISMLNNNIASKHLLNAC